MVIQPWLRQRTAHLQVKSRRSSFIRVTGVFLTGLYGGYFGAAQGVLLMALLGTVIDEGIQRLNAMKNVLAAVANTSAAFVFVIRGGVNWKAAGIIAVGAIIGGQLGAHIGRRLPAPVYRAVIVIVGLAAFFKLVLT